MTQILASYHKEGSQKIGGTISHLRVCEETFWVASDVHRVILDLVILEKKNVIDAIFERKDETGL